MTIRGVRHVIGTGVQWAVRLVCLVTAVGLCVRAATEPTFELEAFAVIFFSPALAIGGVVAIVGGSLIAPWVRIGRSFLALLCALAAIPASLILHEALIHASRQRGDDLMAATRAFIAVHGRCPVTLAELPGDPPAGTYLLGNPFYYAVEDGAPAPKCNLGVGFNYRDQDSPWQYNIV